MDIQFWCRRCGRKRNQNYELCYECYKDGEPEVRVEKAVFDYFSKFHGFSTKCQHDIRIGTYTPRPDVVLFDQHENLAAIAECKRGGIVGYGIDQLKSYLIASDVQFGVFANSTEPDEWIFFENLRRYRFKDDISRPQFEAEILADRPMESVREEKDRLDNEIGAKKQQHKRLSAKINSLTENECSLTERTNKLKSELKTLEWEKKKLGSRVENDKRYHNFLKRKNAKLEKSIKDKNDTVRDLDRLSRLDELEAAFDQESIYGHIREELERLGELESEIKSKQQLALQRNSVETNQKEQQLAQVSQKKESILKQLRVVVNQLKAASSEQQAAQIEENRRQLVRDFRERKSDRGKLIKEISRLKEAKSELEEEIGQVGQQLSFEENEVCPAYVQIQLEIDELKTEKSKIEAKIGHRIFLRLS